MYWWLDGSENQQEYTPTVESSSQFDGSSADGKINTNFKAAEIISYSFSFSFARKACVMAQKLSILVRSEFLT